MSLGVTCECGLSLGVTEKDAGSMVRCSCGRPVVVPLLEEFQNHTVLLSAATVERRAQRLVAEGVLPGTDECLWCREVPAQRVDVIVQCERYTAHTSGGMRLLIMPIPLGFVRFIWWEEPERLEIRGRDTDVPAPVCLCETCRSNLRAPSAVKYLLLEAVVVVLGGVLAFINLLMVIGLVAVGLALLVLARRLAVRNWQQKLKRLLGKVPVYRQVLQSYPRAVVVMSK
jgi:hypothetical protein